MLLAIDIGNSRVKWGWHDDGKGWVERHVADHVSFLAQLPGSAPLGHKPGRVILCNVASPILSDQVEHAVAAIWPRAHVTQFRSAPNVAGIRNAYDHPATLGADRLAAAVGARVQVREGALVVVSFGTATTIDTVSPDNVFLGGVIVPGLALMLRSLAHNTARLPHGATQPVIHDVPSSTQDAIAEGVMRAQIGAVRDTYERAVRRFGAATLIVTGGAAQVVAWRLSMPVQLVDNLVFEGLLRIDGMQS